jgi:hypothetical protein
MIWEKRKNPALYRYYMDNAVKFAAGAGQWQKLALMGDAKLMDVATAQDETLALLMYENYHDQWVDTHFGVTTARHAKYTKQGFWYRVWSDAGIERFNELLQEVKNDRESETGLEMESMYQRGKCAAISRSCKRRRVLQPSRVHFTNDLEEVSDSESSSDED